jgi:CRISPR/Cas system-associated protein Cas5 (RAMP superfamily)
MSPNEWAGLAVAVTTLIGALAIAVRHLVKYYLSELKQNGGSSIKDQVNRLEEKVQFLTDLVKESLTR